MVIFCILENQKLILCNQMQNPWFQWLGAVGISKGIHLTKKNAIY